jgi:MFS family permease
MVGRGVADAFMVFVLPLSEEFGWQRAQVTSVYSIFLVVTGFRRPHGMLIDRLGARVVYPLGLLLLGRRASSHPRCRSSGNSRSSSGSVGAGVSMLGMVPASMLISRWFRDRMSTAMGVAYAGFGTGTIVVGAARAALDRARGLARDLLDDGRRGARVAAAASALAVASDRGRPAPTAQD